MKMTFHKLLFVLMLTAAINVTDRIAAQESGSPLMAGLEQPFSQPVFQSLALESSSRTFEIDTLSEIQQQSHSVYSELSSQNCGNQQCTDCNVSAESCESEKCWWDRKTHAMNRKCYFNYHGYHPKALHPIVHPACQPGYGYYETCWRKIAPNPCYCQPAYGPGINPGQISPEAMNQRPSLQGEPLLPAPAYDN